MNIENLKSTVKSAGWQDVIEFFNDEILTEKKLTKVDINKRFEDIALETIARHKASKIVTQALNKIQKAVTEITINKQSYK